MRRGVIGIVTTLLAMLASSLVAPAAPAAVAVNGIFNLTDTPKYLTEGADGNIYVTLSGTNDIARVTPAGVVTEFDSPIYSNPIGITSGPDGNLWVTQPGAVLKVVPGAPGAPIKTPLASITDARAITTGPDGNLWTGSGDQLIKIPPAAPATATATTITGMGARGISADSDSVWIADFGSQRIVQADPANLASPTFFNIGGNPQEVAASPGLDQVAFGNPGSQTVGRITNGGMPQTTPAPASDPFGVTLGADGAWWFAQFATNNLGRLTQAGAYTTLGGLPAASGPRYITSGPNNTLWVGLEASKQIARVTGVDAPPPAAPQTTIESATKTAKAGKKGAKAKFSFSATPAAGATFECALKRKGKANKAEKKRAKFAACTSPKKYKKLRKGKYTFKVRASVGGVSDGSPAKSKLKVKTKKR
jgi:streptogramin lyase